MWDMVSKSAALRRNADFTSDYGADRYLWLLIKYGVLSVIFPTLWSVITPFVSKAYIYMRKDESMGYKYYSVINIQNRYKTLVLAVNESDESGDAQEKIQYYTLLEGERLIDAAPPAIRPYAGADGFIKPVWEGSEWMESAANEEIAAWEAEHPAPPSPTPSREQQGLADIALKLAQQEAAIKQLQQSNSVLMTRLLKVQEGVKQHI